MTTGILLGQNDNEAIPEGIIVAWSGSKNNIPQGWVLCDGTNGTPDLRDRFILGAGTKYSYSKAGGEDTHILSVDEMPAHTHDFSSKSEYFKGMYAGGIGSNLTYGTGCATTEEGSGGKPLTITYTGGDSAHNNMPPYYALCYICYKKGFFILQQNSFIVIPKVSGAVYGFSLNNNNYYESQNKGVKNSYAIARVTLDMYTTGDCTIKYISYGESGFDYGVIGKLDTSLTLSSEADSESRVAKSAKEESSGDIKTYTFSNISTGQHYFDIKYRKDSSNDAYNDSMQFKITLS